MERIDRVHAELVNEQFGERLSSIRKRKGLSQLELARAVGLSRGSISNLETGIQNVQLHQIFAFALALDAPLDEFIPLLRDAIVYEDGTAPIDRVFLEVSKRQLIEADDDENA